MKIVFRGTVAIEVDEKAIQKCEGLSPLEMMAKCTTEVYNATLEIVDENGYNILEEESLDITDEFKTILKTL